MAWSCVPTSRADRRAGGSTSGFASRSILSRRPLCENSRFILHHKKQLSRIWFAREHRILALLVYAKSVHDTAAWCKPQDGPPAGVQNVPKHRHQLRQPGIPDICSTRTPARCAAACSCSVRSAEQRNADERGVRTFIWAAALRENLHRWTFRHGHPFHSACVSEGAARAAQDACGWSRRLCGRTAAYLAFKALGEPKSWLVIPGRVWRAGLRRRGCGLLAVIPAALLRFSALTEPPPVSKPGTRRD